MTNFQGKRQSGQINGQINGINGRKSIINPAAKMPVRKYITWAGLPGLDSF